MLLFTRATPIILSVYSKRGGATFSGAGGSLDSVFGTAPGLADEDRVLMTGPVALGSLDGGGASLMRLEIRLSSRSVMSSGMRVMSSARRIERGTCSMRAVVISAF